MTLYGKKGHLLGPEDHGKEFGFSSKDIWEALGGRPGEECTAICVDYSVCSCVAGRGSFGKPGIGSTLLQFWCPGDV